MSARAPQWRPRTTSDVSKMLSNICYEGDQDGTSVPARKAQMIRALRALPDTLPIDNPKYEPVTTLKSSANMAGYMRYVCYSVLSKGMHWTASRAELIRVVEGIPQGLPLRAPLGRNVETCTIKTGLWHDVEVGGRMLVW